MSTTAQSTSTSATTGNRKLVLFFKGLIIFVLVFPWLLAVAMGVTVAQRNSNLRTLAKRITGLEGVIEAREDEPGSENTEPLNSFESSSTLPPFSETTSTPITPPRNTTTTPILPPATPSRTSLPALPSVATPPATVVKSKVYLTFSGGPSANTAKILDILKANKVKATFFVSATSYAKRDTLMQRIVNEGHTLGVESYSSTKKTLYASSASCIDDYLKMEQLVSKVTSTTPRYYRFPGGSNTKNASSEVINAMIVWLRSKNIAYYDWNVTSGENASKPPKATAIAAKVKKGVNASSVAKVVLLHDGSAYSTTPAALKTILKNLKKEKHPIYRITATTSPVHKSR